jgi:hypothetical protein
MVHKNGLHYSLPHQQLEPAFRLMHACKRTGWAVCTVFAPFDRWAAVEICASQCKLVYRGPPPPPLYTLRCKDSAHSLIIVSRSAPKLLSCNDMRVQRLDRFQNCNRAVHLAPLFYYSMYKESTVNLRSRCFSLTIKFTHSAVPLEHHLKP